MLRRSILPLLLLLVIATPASSQTFVFDLRGAQEVPPVPSTATGGCHGVLNQPAQTFTLNCVHNVVGPTVMHIHRAPAGVNGDIVFDLGNPASPVTATWTGMTAQNIDDLLDGNLYLNIHTAGRPSGEIRGQILSRTVDFVAFTADGAQVVPPNSTSATGNCTADLDAGATAVAINCTHTLPSPVSAHVHDGPVGTNGPSIFTFPSPASPLSANVPLTPLQVGSFAAIFLYVDVHTAGGTEESPSQEIRGQIGTPPVAPTSGTVIIAKETFPPGGSGFGFSETITPGVFLLNDGQTRTFSNVTAGTYTVTENDPSGVGYSVADVRCNDLNSVGDSTARTATINLEAGETVRCTFRNFAAAPTDDLFVFHLSGDQEVPPIITPERGGCMGRFRSGSSELSLVCTHDVDLATVMHIHQGAPGVNGPIVHDLGDPTSPVISTWSGMTPEQVGHLMAGNYYVNIHTSGRPSGIIRGQILPRTVDTVPFTADASQVVPPGTSGSTANCQANLDDPATQLAVSCTHNMPSPDSAHVHQAPRGENGPVVHTFPSPASPLNGNVSMTPRLVADFAGQFLYLDIHGQSGSEEAVDQIRGQIATPLPTATTGTVRIVKSTSPAGGPSFAFADNLPGTPGAFSLSDTQVRTFSGVAAGTYTVTEADPSGSGYSLTDVSCDDVDSTGNPFARNATIRLQAGEVVTCTFHNLRNVTAPMLFVFHLSGTQEVPPNDSIARGGCMGQFDPIARSFALVCTHNVVGAGVTHIHRAPAGANGPIAFDLGDPASPIEATWTGMSVADVNDLLSGNLYMNIHASGRPDGEIRGQILPRTVDSFSFPADASQEVPPTDSTALGSCSADLATDATSLFVRCRHNVPSPTVIHLHDAPPGLDGPAVFDFPATATFQDNVPMTPRLVADFAAGFLYVNIHSALYTEGEIRGQLIAGGAAFQAADVPSVSGWAMLLMMLALVGMGWWRAR